MLVDNEWSAIRSAFHEAQRRRPFQLDKDVVAAATPPGGDWECVFPRGAVSRSIMWRGQEVATMNPQGVIPDATEGAIAMAIKAIPTVDAAMRSIIVLAENPENLSLIRNLAISAVALIEQPAPGKLPCHRN